MSHLTFDAFLLAVFIFFEDVTEQDFDESFAGADGELVGEQVA